MNTIQQTIIIPPDRRLHLDLTLPEDIPAGRAEMLVVLSPAPLPQKQAKGKFVRHLAGRLANSAAFAGDSVAAQRAVRDEW